MTNDPKTPDALIVGRLLADPDRPAEPGWLTIRDGFIDNLGHGPPPAEVADLPRLGGRTRVISPAFTDAHTHLPQVDSVGCDGLELLDWLHRVIFPAETWWGHAGSMPMARRAVRSMLENGAAAFAGYLSSHAEPNAAVLRWLAAATPMRYICGRSAMDRDAPDELTDEDRRRRTMSPTPAPVLPVRDADGPAPRGLATGLRARMPSAIPRFAISCTDELLAELGWWIADHQRRTGAWVQTHLAESPGEIERTRALFPDDPSYTAVYDRFGLLNDRTLLAHCIHLADDEWALLRERRAVVVHCPTANTFLQAGLFDLDAAERHGVRLALGSDVAGGPDAAMPRVARAMIEVAKVRRLAARDRGEPHDHIRVPTPADAWRLITETNARELGWTDMGRLEPGASATLLVLHPPEVWLDEHLVGRLIYNWSPELIEHLLVGGAPASPATI